MLVLIFIDHALSMMPRLKFSEYLWTCFSDYLPVEDLIIYYN